MAILMHERSTGGETPELAQWENQGHEEITAMHGTSRSETAEAQVRETMTAAVELSADGFLQQINEYECIRDLGVGATAEVKLCRRVDRQSGEEELVAVKVFNKSLLNRQARGFAFSRRKKASKRDSQVLEKVRREVALMKKLVHPNVVRLLEVIDDPQNDLLFMAMEFVHNGPVMVWEEETGQYVSPETGGVLPPRTAAAYFRGMLDGLEFLHGNHVVHRDLKPENVLLTKDGVAKIADFGVAHIFDEQEQSEANGHDLTSEREDADSRDRHRHQLTQPEGTWCFWAPEICTTSNVAKERAMQAARARALGAEAAKAMALGGSTTVEMPKGSPATGGKEPLAITDSSTHRPRANIPSVRHSLRRQGTYNAFAADVWAAGVCLWVFRFGKPPFYDPDPSNLFVGICRRPLLFPENADEGDEEVIAAEEEEAKARAQAAAMAKDKVAEQGESRRRRYRRQAAERSSADAPSVLPIEIPEYSMENEDDDMDVQSPGQLPALGRYPGKKKTKPSLRRPGTFDGSASSSSKPAPLVKSQLRNHDGHNGDRDDQRRSLSASAAGAMTMEYKLILPPEAPSTPPRASPLPSLPPEQEWFRRTSRCSRFNGSRSSSVDAPSISRKLHSASAVANAVTGDSYGVGNLEAGSGLLPPGGSSTGEGFDVYRGNGAGGRMGGGSTGGLDAAGTGNSASGAGSRLSFSASSSMRKDGFSSGPVSGSKGLNVGAGEHVHEISVEDASTGVSTPVKTVTSAIKIDAPSDAAPVVIGEEETEEEGVTSEKLSGTLRNLLLSLLNKKVSDRITVRGAQEHMWMHRMCPRSGEPGSDEHKGAPQNLPPPFKQVSVTAGEVKGAIVHINSLFVISMVKSRLTQRLTRARKNIARRRLQAAKGEKYGPSLSDTEQEHLREVRDLTEALTKDESVLVHHHLAHEPERSLSDSDLPTATYSGTWPSSSHRSRRGVGPGGSGGIVARDSQGNVYSNVTHRLYKRSASRVAGRDSVHTAISNFFGEREGYGHHHSHGRSHRHGDKRSERRGHGHGERRSGRGSKSNGGGSERRRKSSRGYSRGHTHSHPYGYRAVYGGKEREGRRRRVSRSGGRRRESAVAVAVPAAALAGAGAERDTGSVAALSAAATSSSFSSRNMMSRDGSQSRSISGARALSSGERDFVDPDHDQQSRYRRRDRHGDPDQDRDRYRNRDRDGHKHRDRERHREREGERKKDRDGERHRDRDGERHRNRDGEQHHDREGERHRDRDGERHRDRDGERHRRREGERHRDREEERHRSRDGEKHRDRDGEKHRNRDGERPRERDGGKHRDRDGERHRNRDGEQHRNRDGERHRNRDGERHRDRDGERHRERDGEQHRDCDGEQHRDREGEQRNREGDVHRERDGERHRDRDGGKHREYAEERHGDRDVERHRGGEAERHRDRNQDQQRTNSLAVPPKSVSGPGRRQSGGSMSSDMLTLAPSSSTVGARSSVGGGGGSSGYSKNYSRSYSTHSIVSVPGGMSPAGSESGSFSSDFSRSDGEGSSGEGSDDDNEDARSEQYKTLQSFGSEGSSRSGNSGRSRGSFKVFGITRGALQLKNMRRVSRTAFPQRRQLNGPGGFSNERNEGSGTFTPVKANKESALARLSSGVLSNKKRLKNSKSPGGKVDVSVSGNGNWIGGSKSESGGSIHGENCASARSHVSMASIGSFINGGSDSDAGGTRTPGADSMNSDESSYYRPASRGGTRSDFVTTASAPLSKPPPGPSVAVAAAAARRTHAALAAESTWSASNASIGGVNGGSSQNVRTGRRKRRMKKDSCDVS